MGYDLFMTILDMFKHNLHKGNINSLKVSLTHKRPIPGILGNRYMNVRERFLQGPGVVVQKNGDSLLYKVVKVDSVNNTNCVK